MISTAVYVGAYLEVEGLAIGDELLWERWQEENEPRLMTVWELLGGDKEIIIPNGKAMAGGIFLNPKHDGDRLEILPVASDLIGAFASEFAEEIKAIQQVFESVTPKAGVLLWHF